MQVVVSISFSTRADGRTMGLVTGSGNGTNHLVAKHLRGGGGQLKITNHPIGRPILLSSKSSPWVCATGVCDTSNPGVGQQPAQSPLDFSAGLAEFHFRHPSRHKSVLDIDRAPRTLRAVFVQP